MATQAIEKVETPKVVLTKCHMDDCWGDLTFEKGCTSYGEPICDWCAGMWLHDCAPNI